MRPIVQMRLYVYIFRKNRTANDFCGFPQFRPTGSVAGHKHLPLVTPRRVAFTPTVCAAATLRWRCLEWTHLVRFALLPQKGKLADFTLARTLSPLGTGEDASISQQWPPVARMALAAALR